jgi:hypothetical protein
MKTISNFRFFFIFLLISAQLITTQVYAQDEFIKVKTTESLTTDEQKKWDKLKNNKNLNDVYFIEFGDLLAQQQKGSISFAIPKLPKKIEAYTLRMEYQSPTEYHWFATTKDGLSSIVIQRTKDKYSGYISIPSEGEYEIMDIGESKPKHIFIKHNSLTYKKECSYTDKTHKNGRQGILDLKSARIAPCTGPIRILVLYTPEAVQQTGMNPFDVASNAVSQYNNTIYRINIPSGTSATIAGVIQFNLSLSNNINTDVQNLYNNSIAQNLRDQYLADIVVLLIQEHPSVYGGVAGNNEPDNQKSYVIVQMQQAVSNKIFAHEVGHLFGCRHTTAQDSQGQPYAHAYRFLPNPFSSYCNTLMYNNANANIIENFSNPEVSVSGHATGTYNNEHNARRVSETAATVNNHRSEPNILWGTMEGTTYGYVYNSYTWEAVVSCGNQPYSYQWRTSNDGFNWSSVRGTGEYFSDYLPWTGNNYYYLWLQISSSDGQVTNAYSTVYIDYSQGGARLSASNDPIPLLAPIMWKPLAETKKTEGIKLTTFPNPAAKEITIEFALLTDQYGTLDIVDVTGRIVKSLLKGTLSKGTTQQVVAIQNLPNGAYLVRLSTQSSTLVQKILVAH